LTKNKQNEKNNQTPKETNRQTATIITIAIFKRNEEQQKMHACIL